MKHSAKSVNEAQQYLDVAGHMFIALDSEGTVALVNKKGCELLGWDESEILGKDWFDNFLPEDLGEQVKKGFRTLIAGTVEPVEYCENPIVRKDGSQRIVAWHNTVLRDADGRIIGTLSSGEDITERKKAQEALLEKEEHYRTMIESSHEVIFCKDRDGRYHSLNLNTAIGLGSTCIEDVAGKTDHDLLPKERADTLRATDEKVMESGKTMEIEEAVSDTQGRERIYLSRKWPTYDDQGRISGIGCFSIDITERKQMEEQVAQSREMFSKIFYANPMPATMTTISDDKLVLVNDAWLKLIGFDSPEEAIGKSAVELGLWADIEDREERNTSLKRGSSSGNQEIRVRTPSGEIRDCIYTAEMIDYEGRPHILSMAVDVTDRNRLKEKAR